jgi:hypothetical protein
MARRAAVVFDAAADEARDDGGVVAMETGLPHSGQKRDDSGRLSMPQSTHCFIVCKKKKKTKQTKTNQSNQNQSNKK